MALEDIESSQKADEVDKTSLEAAAAWFAYAAPTLWALSEQGKEFQGKIAKQGQAIKEKQWRGFNKERWQFWEEKLGACGDEVKLVAKAREAVQGGRELGVVYLCSLEQGEKKQRQKRRHVYPNPNPVC
jgi:hypothetical protein